MTRRKGDYIDNPTYAAVHKRVRVTNGKASLYQCYFCGDDAKEWACISNKTQKDSNGLFSLNIDDYVPSCIPCHKKMDNVPKGLCRYGHDNWSNGKQRHCKTCRQIREGRYRG
jgi:hypothetical protein